MARLDITSTACLLALILGVGCSSSDDGVPGAAAGSDASFDGSDASLPDPDASEIDVASEAAPDSSSDVGLEAAPDALSDVAPDALSDAAPQEPRVLYVGRHEPQPSGAVRFGWSGTGFVVRFHGTGALVRMDDPSGFFTVVVDGQEQERLVTAPGEVLYPLVEGLPDGEHVVEVYRRAEGFFGPTTVHEVQVDGDLLAPPVADRRIEVLGDSITCGYGNEGPDQYCGFSADTENHYKTYAAIAARALDAELSSISWSGKGAIFNYGEDKDHPLPTLFRRTIPTEDPSPWDFAWQPHAVVVNLGTNDFSTDGDPTESEFVGAYVAMLEEIRTVYPDAFVLCTVAPLLSEADTTLVMGYIQQAVDARIAAGDSRVSRIDLTVVNDGWGCDWHPSITTHEAMASLLEDELRSALGW